LDLLINSKIQQLKLDTPFAQNGYTEFENEFLAKIVLNLAIYFAIDSNQKVLYARHLLKSVV
jgi:hypothetical protein